MSAGAWSAAGPATRGRRLRVLIAPDKMAGTATAAEVAHDLAWGWARVRPDDEVLQVPIADGGPGFLDVLARSVPRATVEAVTVTGPTGRRVRADVVRTGTTAYVESAQAAGLALVALRDRDPQVLDTGGVGRLLRAAAGGGTTRVVVGLGGSATVDGGLGMLRELGLGARGVTGRAVGTGLRGVCAAESLVGASSLDPDVTIQAACDVTAPLVGPRGAVRVYGPQKGLAAEDMNEAEDCLGRWSRLLERTCPASPPDLAEQPGAGAAGGLGAGLIALGAETVSGFDAVSRALGLPALVAEADLVITGEGRLDRSSLEGKAVGEMLATADRQGVPCAAVAGSQASDVDVGGLAVLTLTGLAASQAEAMRRTRSLLVAAGAALAARQ